MRLPEEPLRRPLDRKDSSERNLVLAGWLHTYLGQAAGIPSSVLARLLSPHVQALIARSTVDVACLADAPGAVLGWLATEGERLHYVCVKPRWQRLGVATWLLAPFADKDMVVTHRTWLGSKLGPYPRWTYDPRRQFEETAA